MQGRLAGIRVMLTHSARESRLSERLRALGAVVSTVPLIKIGPPRDAQALQRAVDASDHADWIVFTSVNGVDAFARRRREKLPPDLRIAAIGPATARAVEHVLARPADLVPPRFIAEELGDAIIHHAGGGARVTIFAAQAARPELAARLRKAGMHLTTAVAYETREAPPTDLVRRIADVDVIVLTSGSAVRSLIAGLRSGLGVAALDGKALVCIGPVTADEACRRGLTVAATAQAATPDGLLAAIASAAKR